MYKCWNCGTEHEDSASNDAYIRGWNAALQQAIHEIVHIFQYVEDPEGVRGIQTLEDNPDRPIHEWMMFTEDVDDMILRLMK